MSLLTNFIIFLFIFKGKDSNPEDYESVALYFEKENNNFLAGKYYYMASSFNKVSFIDFYLNECINLNRNLKKH